MLLKIIPYGNPILRKQSEPVEKIDSKIAKLVDNMLDTMRAAKGIGLAAPQVDESRMLFVINWSVLENDEISKEGVETYINPKILSISGKKVSEAEGCLSLPEISAEVDRADEIEITYQNLEGKEIRRTISGFPARVIQHEYDHLQGILFIDRISAAQRAKIKEKLQDILAGRIKPFDGTQPTGEAVTAAKTHLHAEVP